MREAGLGIGPPTPRGGPKNATDALSMRGVARRRKTSQGCMRWWGATSSGRCPRAPRSRCRGASCWACCSRRSRGPRSPPQPAPAQHALTARGGTTGAQRTSFERKNFNTEGGLVAMPRQQGRRCRPPNTHTHARVRSSSSLSQPPRLNTHACSILVPVAAAAPRGTSSSTTLTSTCRASWQASLSLPAAPRGKRLSHRRGPPSLTAAPAL